MVSLPIPEDPSPVSFGECLIGRRERSISPGQPGCASCALVRRNRRGCRSAAIWAPTLTRICAVRAARTASPGGGRCSAQVGAAQQHLANCGVGPGDVFLFFGWFAHVRDDGTGRLRYARGDRGFQAIWAWMEIAEAMPAEKFAARHPWAWRQHPHLHPVVPPHYTRNTIYAATAASSLVPGALGAAALRYSGKSCLTKPGSSPSVWSLPACFHPDSTKTPLTFHGSRQRWSAIHEDEVTLRSVAPGQEFVVPVSEGIEDWLTDLIATASTW